MIPLTHIYMAGIDSPLLFYLIGMGSPDSRLVKTHIKTCFINDPYQIPKLQLKEANIQHCTFLLSTKTV